MHLIICCVTVLTACDDEAQPSSTEVLSKPISITVQLPEEIGLYRAALQQASIDLKEACQQVNGPEPDSDTYQITVKVELEL